MSRGEIISGIILPRLALNVKTKLTHHFAGIFYAGHAGKGKNLYNSALSAFSAVRLRRLVSPTAH
jgi:hypothetical protein